MPASVTGLSYHLPRSLYVPATHGVGRHRLSRRRDLGLPGHALDRLGFGATIEWMQRSLFCVCPPGDVPYNKRYFTALLAGCVPVLLSWCGSLR